MSVRIQFDEPRNFYTNLDFISGRVLLSLSNDETVSGIFVKLEGESRSVLMRPIDNMGGRRRDRTTVSMENHKVLYKVAKVFPTEQSIKDGLKGQQYTLGAGQHEYPFRFKFPFNNSCSEPDSQLMGTGAGFGLGGLQQMQYRHVKRTLPPSLTGFPGEAEIRYFVKVTVQRPGIFRENRRSAVGFRFLPIEPPRPTSTNEVFARRPYAFKPGSSLKSGLFGGKRSGSLSDMPPKGEIEARLPSPAILTCNEPVPLRLILKNLNESPEQLYLTSLQINLCGSTEIRAQDVARTEAGKWAMMSLKSLMVPIGSPGDKVRTETVVDKKLWDSVPLPNTVAPSFHTCNLTRSYELEVEVGLGCGPLDPSQAIILPLRFQIEIYSGISPPTALLNAMSSRRTASASRPSASRPAATAAGRPAPKPVYDPVYPPQLTTSSVPEDDVPPSYEDAMADDIAPADGPRREYSGVTDVNAPTMDEKAPRYSATPGGRGQGGGSSSTGL